MNDLFWHTLVIVNAATSALLGLLVIGLLRYIGTIQERIQLVAPPITRFVLGEPVGTLQLVDRLGRPTIWDPAGMATSGVLLFVTPACSACSRVLEQIRELVERGSAQTVSALTIVVIGPLEAAQHDGLLAIFAQAGAQVLIEPTSTAAASYGITALPIGLALAAGGTVVDQTVNPHANDWLFRWVAVDPSAYETRGAGDVGRMVAAADMGR